MGDITFDFKILFFMHGKKRKCVDHAFKALLLLLQHQLKVTFASKLQVWNKERGIYMQETTEDT